MDAPVMFKRTSFELTIAPFSPAACSSSMKARPSRLNSSKWTFIERISGVPDSLYAALPPFGVAPLPTFVVVSSMEPNAQPAGKPSAEPTSPDSP